MTTSTLSWALCLATLNRPDVLAKCVDRALRQTRPPTEIVICDSGDDWRASATRIRRLIGEREDLRLTYIPCDIRSTAVQRNMAACSASADILFLIDDDAFMENDCAEKIMSVYEKDEAGRIAAVGAANVSSKSAQSGDDDDAITSRPSFGVAMRGRVASLTKRSRLAKYVIDEVLMMSIDNRFVPYDSHTRHFTQADFDALADDFDGLIYTRHIYGYALTVRRAVADKEPFDDNLLRYSPGEDLDATYRYSRHGLNVYLPAAALQHMESAQSRLKREIVHTLSNANNAYFVRKNAEDFPAVRKKYFRKMRRNLVAAAIKDLAKGHLSFPDAKTMMKCFSIAEEIFEQPLDRLDPWYQDRQLTILEPTK